MNGIIYTRSSKDYATLLNETKEQKWVQLNTYSDALFRLQTDINLRWILLDSDRSQEHEMYNILQYRGQFIGQKSTLNLYSVTSVEGMYLRLMQELIAFGHLKDRVRTETDVFSLFGKHLRFNLQHNTLPLLTTKRVYFKGVAKELLWFLRGSTDTKALQADNIKIWDGNASREYLDKVGLSHYKEGELGPIYGYQWRNWGKPYKTNHPHQREGIDQITKIIHTIKTNPHDRRMVLSAWNVSQLSEMALPPCHVLSQFYVHETNDGVKHLSCSMYQRSADIFLGVPFNIASYALLTHMIAHVTGCVAHELIINFGDTHIYTNHLEKAKTQLERSVKRFPTVRINPEKKNIDDIQFDDIFLENYESDTHLPAPMAV